jgi:hypothetical protein
MGAGALAGQADAVFTSPPRERGEVGPRSGPGEGPPQIVWRCEDPQPATPCGKICSTVTPCGFNLSPACNAGKCVVVRDGQCPVRDPRPKEDAAGVSPAPPG